MKKIIFALLVVVVMLTLRPLWHAGLFDVHDPTSAFRLSTLVETLGSGQFPAAWNNHLNFGFGYPLHLYYAPLFTYLGAIFTPFVSTETAVKLAIVVTSFVGTFGVYYLLSGFGSSVGGLGAIAYTLLPYRASALYVRGSYSEFLAMSVLPWVIYFWTKPQNRPKTIFLTGLTTALFVLSHNTLPILLVPVLLLLILLYQAKFLRGSILTLLLTFGLSAWFVLPVIFERNFIQVDAIAQLTNFHDHFLYLSQLWSSPWGYGGSGVGIAGDHMSFMIGKGQLLLALIGALALAWRRRWRSLTVYGFIISLFIFLSLGSSAFVWDAVPLLPLLQFPWRTLTMIGVGVTALSGLSLIFVPPKQQTIAVLILSALLVYTNLRYFIPQDYRTYSQVTLSSPEILDPLARDKIPEYLPTWMPTFPAAPKSDGLTRDATSVRGTLTLPTPSILTLSTAYMPQWRLTIDGTPSALTPNSAGLITTIQDVNLGTHAIALTWHRTLVENIGLDISAITLAIMIGLQVL